jgi:hypothetical protein
VQVAIIGYGENTTVSQKRLEPVAKARTAMKALEADDATTGGGAGQGGQRRGERWRWRTKPKQVGVSCSGRS